ncbi:hypothetical protein [Marilutibacter chinensis]|uniref:Uncharacterized protein n=1 Tax=Marilutibacter chinensis TaxID=2912247 RepID=A0ABS9HZJ3_9GAMM|nr:hypothetical protein [Lysobacter chinensis]MCF7223492.1 hypothetical protein [Lysobacter chinensis]
MAAEPAFPPLPQEPEWHEPVPLEVTMRVTVDGCDSGPGSPMRINRFEPELRPDGTLKVEGWVMHNGSDRVDPDWTRAWSQGERLMLAYRYRPDVHPMEPILMCPAFSRLSFEVRGLDRAPDTVEVYSGKFGFKRVEPYPADNDSRDH